MACCMARSRHPKCQPLGNCPNVGNGPGRLPRCHGSRPIHVNQLLDFAVGTEPALPGSILENLGFGATWSGELRRHR